LVPLRRIVGDSYNCEAIRDGKCQSKVVEHVRVFNRIGFLARSSQEPQATGVVIMGGKTDVAKGRIKEAAGVLTGNDKLRAEGKADQTVGEVKQVADKAVDKVKQAVKKLRD